MLPRNCFDGIMDVNFKGAYFTLSRFIPILNDGASVVFSFFQYRQYEWGYNICLFIQQGCTQFDHEIAAVELAPRKIRVNAVSPGPIETDL